VPEGSPGADGLESEPLPANRAKRQIGLIVAALIVLVFAALIVAKAGSSATVAPSVDVEPGALRRLYAVEAGHIHVRAGETQPLVREATLPPRGTGQRLATNASVGSVFGRPP
jgi:hypothetical protein